MFIRPDLPMIKNNGRVREVPAAQHCCMEGAQTDLSASIGSMVTQLALCCPHDRGNPCFCPLYMIRKMPLEQRFAWLKSQSEVDLISLLDRHAICLADLKRAGVPATVSGERSFV